MAFRGVDIRESGDRVIIRASLKDSSGARVTSGTTSLRLYELQSDGSLNSYDFADNTFKATALTTETASMTHRAGNNGTFNTGIWTYSLTILTGFTVGNIYIAVVDNTGAVPAAQEREFQYGSGQGADVRAWNGTAPAALADTDKVPASVQHYAESVKPPEVRGEVTGTPTSGQFDGNAGLSATDDFYNGAILCFVTGALAGQARRVGDYTGLNKTFLFDGAGEAVDAPFPSAPAAADKFVILGRIGPL